MTVVVPLGLFRWGLKSGSAGLVVAEVGLLLPVNLALRWEWNGVCNTNASVPLPCSNRRTVQMEQVTENGVQRIGGNLRHDLAHS